MSRWYIIHAYSGFENKVRDAILSEAKRIGLEPLRRADRGADRDGDRDQARQEGPGRAQVHARLRPRQARAERRGLSPRQEHAEGHRLPRPQRQAAADPRRAGRAHARHQGRGRRPRPQGTRSASITRSAMRSRCSTAPSPASTASSRNSTSTAAGSRSRSRSSAARRRSSWSSSRSSGSNNAERSDADAQRRRSSVEEGYSALRLLPNPSSAVRSSPPAAPLPSARPSPAVRLGMRAMSAILVPGGEIRKPRMPEILNFAYLGVMEHLL